MGSKLLTKQKMTLMWFSETVTYKFIRKQCTMNIEEVLFAVTTSTMMRSVNLILIF